MRCSLISLLAMILVCGCVVGSEDEAGVKQLLNGNEIGAADAAGAVLDLIDGVDQSESFNLFCESSSCLLRLVIEPRVVYYTDRDDDDPIPSYLEAVRQAGSIKVATLTVSHPETENVDVDLVVDSITVGENVAYQTLLDPISAMIPTGWTTLTITKEPLDAAPEMTFGVSGRW